MATRLTLGIEGSTRDGPTRILVQESFDEVMDKFWPLSSAPTAIENRANAIFTTMENKRVLIKTPSIIIIEEDCEENDS